MPKISYVPDPPPPPTQDGYDPTAGSDVDESRDEVFVMYFNLYLIIDCTKIAGINTAAYRSEIQLILTTVVIGSISVFTTFLRSILDVSFYDIHMNHLQKISDVVFAYFNILALGFINSNVRHKILQLVKCWKSRSTTTRVEGISSIVI
ncbi:unnamed protein product [Cylicocyclus nassatus]|uniref:Uncharacterized protein n=1 Tax=Cylicocyclus nassatus TaxID=53992 RepID=A0AA36MC19_CYLNA|nr:unnamed protein product [Cylicocyclus nassatus]